MMVMSKCCVLLMFVCVSVAADEIQDKKIAQRVVSLAPHLSEIVYAIGAGNTLVGVTSFSDYPAEIRTLPFVGDAHRLDQEAIVALKPDLVLAWVGANQEQTLQALMKHGIAIYRHRAERLQDIALAMEQIGELTGRTQRSKQVASEFRTALLHIKPVSAAPVRVFYQMWDKPLYTVGGKHFISEVIERCGGTNVFASLTKPAAVVSQEAVLTSGAHMVITTNDSAEGMAIWQAFPGFLGHGDKRFCAVPAAWLERPGPRILQAAARVCQCIGDRSQEPVRRSD